MKRLIIAISCLILEYNAISQNKFIKLIDFNNTPQYSYQILETEEGYVLGYYESCDSLRTICSGIIGLSPELEITKKTSFYNFSINFNAILLDSSKIILSGELYNNIDSVEPSFYINCIDKLTLDSINTYKYSDNDTTKYFSVVNQIVSTKWNNKIVIAGSGIINNDNTGNRGILYIIKENYLIDTFLFIDYVRGNISPWSMYVDDENQLVIHYQINDWDKDIIYNTIIKYDEFYNIVWKKDLPTFLGTNKAIPIGFQHNNGRIIVCNYNNISSNINDVYAVKKDSSIAWKMNWLSIFGGDYSGQSRKILRLKQAKNGDILGVGTYSDLRNDNPDLGNVPFVFRITDYGMLKWLKVYYKNQFNNISNEIVQGSFVDIVETDDEELIVVGSIDNQLEFDSITMGPRIDSDIIIAKLGADGCIVPGCGKLNMIDFETIVSDLHKDMSFQIYPNPTNNILEIKSEHLGEVKIYNLEGNILKNLKIDIKSTIIDISDLSTGLYYLSFISNTGKAFTTKFTKI